MSYLTAAEHQAIYMAGQLYNLIAVEIVAAGPTRDDDLAEIRHHIHAIQHLIRSQVAARTYPHKYRLLGHDTP